MIPTSGDTHAFVGNASDGLTDLGTLGGTNSNAYAINDAGQIVGTSANGYGIQRAFVGNATSGLTDLGTLGGSTSGAHDINSSGQVTGIAQDGNEIPQAFVGNTTSGLTNVNTLGATSSTGYAINDSGQIAGKLVLAGSADVHLFTGNVIDGIVDQGVFGSTLDVSGINGDGRVVGHRTPFGGHFFSAFLWDASTGLLDLFDLLNDSTGWTALYQATDINDAGNIVGVGRFNGQTQAFLLAYTGESTNSGSSGGNTTVPTPPPQPFFWASD